MKILKIIGFAVAALTINQAQAVLITNNDFESGSLAGWTTTSSDVAVSTGISSTFGATLNADNSDNNLTISALDSFFGLTSGALLSSNMCSPQTCVAGQGILQSINVLAGETISFNWNAITLEGGTSYVDAAFLVAGNDIVLLTNGLLGNITTNNIGSHTFSTSGTVNFGFGVINGGDDCCGAQLLIDNVGQAAQVPEPSTLAIFALSLLGFSARRRAK